MLEQHLSTLTVAALLAVLASSTPLAAQENDTSEADATASSARPHIRAS